MTGAPWTEDRLVEILLRDRALYAAEGGATFSGGEPLLQAEFLSGVTTRLKAANVTVALDTAGCVPWKAFEIMLPQTDVVLYDVKAVDPALHRRWTGQDNGLILENLERLSAFGTHRLFIRRPLIGGVNDSPAESDAFLALARRLRVERVDLLIWHDYGDAKARALGRAVRQFEKPDAHQVQRMLHELAGAGIPAQIVS
jgi:pyruvate formate lyase activating enzyme